MADKIVVEGREFYLVPVNPRLIKREYRNYTYYVTETVIDEFDSRDIRGYGDHPPSTYAQLASFVVHEETGKIVKNRLGEKFLLEEYVRLYNESC